MMERVAGAARALAENTRAEEGQSFRGFRQNAEQLTDRLIAAMFPPYDASCANDDELVLYLSKALGLSRDG